MFSQIRRVADGRGLPLECAEKRGNIVPRPKAYTTSFDRFGQIGGPVVVSVYQKNWNPFIVGTLQFPELSRRVSRAGSNDANDAITPFDFCATVCLSGTVPRLLHRHINELKWRPIVATLPN